MSASDIYAKGTENVSVMLDEFAEIAANPKKQLDYYISQGKKVIACFPYYAPEEIIAAAGIVPFGLWGRGGTAKMAKEYMPTFYCSIAQMGLEMVLDGTLDGVSAVLCTTLCDTLRPLTQNLKAACPVPFIFLAYPQNRKKDYGIKFTKAQYEKVRSQTAEIAGRDITGEDLRSSICVYNKYRRECRRFVKLAGLHPETVSAVSRSGVLKAGYFMEKSEYTAKLVKLNDSLENMPVHPWDGVKVVTSGIIMDNPGLLKLFDEQKIAIVADDVAQESRSFRRDADENQDAMTALAMRFADQDDDTILYDPEISGRPGHVVSLVKESGAQGVIIGMMAFCDPEEMEYPSLKKGLDNAGIPSMMFGYEQQMNDFGQAATALEAFADILA